MKQSNPVFIQEGSEPEPTALHCPKPKNGYKIAAFACAALAVASLIFGAIEFMQVSKQAVENSSLRSKVDLLQHETETKLVEKTKEDGTAITVVESVAEPVDLYPATLKSDGLLNPSDFEYVYSNTGHQTEVGYWYISDDAKTVSFNQINQDFVEKYLGLTYANIQGYGSITFPSEVLDVCYGIFGQMDGANATIFFLMKDGTVEYMPFRYALVNNDVRSYGKVSGVEGAVKIQLSSVHVANGAGGHVTTIAVKNDGSFYDLNNALNVIESEYYKR